MLAQEEARVLNHDHIGTEHILLGLIHEGEGVSAKALEQLGVSLETVRTEVEEIIEQGKSSPIGLIPFTPRAKKVLELSLREALQLGHNYIGTEHILLGLIREGEGVAAQVLLKLGADLSRVREQVIELLLESAPSADATLTAPVLLDKFGRNLTQLAYARKVDPAIGREGEIHRVMQVLSRRTKNNPVLIGEPGVSKTAIVEGLAQRIVANMVPVTLKNKQLFALHHDSILRDVADTAGFEGALREASDSGNVILFVEDLQEFLQAPSDQRVGQAASLLKEIILSGRMPVIGSMASEDYSQYVDDSQLADLFQPIPVAEPTVEHTIEILRGVRDRYEAHHRITITDSALVAAAVLAARYIRNRVLPDSAIDLVDEAGARVTIEALFPPRDRELDDELVLLRREKDAAIEAQNFTEAAKVRDREKDLLDRKAARDEELRFGGVDLFEEVEEDDIVAIVSEVTGVSLEKVEASLAGVTRIQAAGSVASDHETQLYTMLHDDPADDPTEDLLGTGRIAAGIASSLARVSSPFVLAIDGGWGVGKSTLLHHIEACLPSSMIKVRFNAWTAQGENALEGLIKSVLGELDPNLIRRWSRKVLKRRHVARIGRLGFAIIARFLGMSRLVDELWARLAVDSQSRNELRHVIHEMLSEWVRDENHRAGRTLVVFVDDLDRCSDDVVIGLCEAVKLYLDAPGLIFVIACDLSVLARGVSTVARGDLGEGRLYLEKIVQVAHRVPVPDTKSLGYLIRGYAERSGTSSLIDDTITELLTEPTGRNPRRIKRIINSFVLEHELNPAWRTPPLGSAELITIVILQHLYPSLYDFLASEESGEDPIADFLDYAEVLARASDPPPAGDAWWSLARRTFQRYGISPPHRSQGDRARVTAELPRIERWLPGDFPDLARNAAVLSLLRGVGDAETRRAVHGQLISRPLGTEAPPSEEDAG